MADAAYFTTIREGLTQADRNLYFAPIRHHSPACAWAVRQLIRSVRPTRVLIEAPVDLAVHIDLVLHEETVPPVAIAAVLEEKQSRRLAAYYPFCEHSPEYIALLEGKAAGARLAFIDLPSGDKAMLRQTDRKQTTVTDDEQYFDSGEYVAALCRQLGCRDGFELWDHLFESRLGDRDWQSFLADVGAYCAGLRAASDTRSLEESGDLAREAHMLAAINEAVGKGDVTVVVAGGFHVPAFIEALADGTQPRVRETGKAADSYFIRYGFGALDALSGYSAGLPQPGYYDYLWQRANAAEGELPWRETALDLLNRFGAECREAGHPISVPAQVEVLRVAEGLARMRGRNGPARHDLIDAVRTALVKGEAGTREAWTERLLEFLRGDSIGNVPASAGSPPLVEDARARAKALRIDVTDGATRRRRLDIRRKPSHLAASQYFHTMSLLDSGFAERQAGPDYVHGINTQRLFEEWSYAWSPRVEGRLIELAVLGDNVADVGIRVLEKRCEELRDEGRGDDIEEVATLFVHGVLSGLGRRLTTLLGALETGIRQHGEFEQVAATLQRLHYLAQASSPLGIPEDLNVDGVLDAAFHRLVYLCDELDATPEERVQAVLEALRSIVELLRNPEAARFDTPQFDAAINRVADEQPPPEILGALLAICVQAGRRPVDELCDAIRGYLTGSVDQDSDRIGVLRGLLVAAPELLWRHQQLLDVVDELLCGLTERDFLELLPHIRLAFTSLNPRETDRLAELLAARHGARATDFAGRDRELSDDDLQRGLRVDQRVREGFEADGLGAWLRATK